VTPTQICSAKSRGGAVMDATLETPVQALCGAAK
jgi:hypothetical protein